MPETIIRFEREAREGVVAVGTYLSDALKRFGIRLNEPCDPRAGLHLCSVSVTRGANLISPLTDREREHFSSSGRRENKRLACEAKIIGPGEIVIMTEEKKKETAEKEERPKMVTEFETLPLEQKIANLVRMEAVTLGETLSFVFNSPFKVIEKVGDVMAEFGMKLEQDAKNAARPAEKEAGRTERAPKKPSTTRKRPVAGPARRTSKK